jgi:hypothetical protein
MFCAEVLPRHAATLIRLAIAPDRHGRWVLRVNLHSARNSSMPVLTHLTMLLNEPNEEDDFLDASGR